MENHVLLKEGAKQLGLTLTAEQIDKFLRFLRLLSEWNRVINLTSIKDEKGVIVKHFLDSLSILPFIEEENTRLIDVGTGGGFPGLPLKLCLPLLNLSLVDATAKKIKYLEAVCAELSIDAVCINARAETLGRDGGHREKYDYATIRAVADMNSLAEYTLPLLKIGGRCLAQKGRDAEAEAAAAEGAVRILGGEIESVRPVLVPFSDFVRNVVIIKKVKHTPDDYPRGPGVPRKRPLR